jgi:heme/copper-type cytochrome/quinol oxidase subunit 2
LYSIDEELDPCVTVKVIGHQWFWTYELNNWFAMFTTLDGETYLKYWKLEFDSILINEEFLKIGTKRLLEVNKSLVLPINVPIRFLITSADVLHSWSVPELGLKIDAVPGRLNQFVSVICRLGRLYGQCSELCGVSHGFMPIVVDGMQFDSFFNYIQRETGIFKMRNPNEFNPVVNLNQGPMNYFKELNAILYNRLLQNTISHTRLQNLSEDCTTYNFTEMFDEDNNKAFYEWKRLHPEIFEEVDEKLEK